MVTADAVFALELKREAHVQRALRRLMLVLAIGALILWSVGVYAAISRGAASTTPAHQINSTCGSAITPC